VALWALFLVAALPLGLREDMEDIADDGNDLSLLSSFVANQIIDKQIDIVVNCRQIDWS